MPSITPKSKILRPIKGQWTDPGQDLFLKLEKTTEPRIGLKACWHQEQIDVRLRHNPKIIEIYLYDGDLENHLEEIEKSIKYLKNKGIEVTIHQPERFKGKPMTMASTNKNITANSATGYKLLNRLCRKYDSLGFIMHPYSGNLDKTDIKRIYKTLDKNKFLENLLSHPEWREKILLENATVGFFKTREELKEIADKTGINICLDLCHLYMSCQNNEKMEETIKELGSRIAYYHLVDTNGLTHDSLEIGQGRIDWSRLIRHIRQGIIEVNCRDQVTAAEMIKSYYTYQKILAREKLKEHLSEKFKILTKNLATPARFFLGQIWQSANLFKRVWGG